MQPWQQAAQQAQRDAQRTIQHGLDAGRRHAQGGGRRPTSVIGRIFNVIAAVIALAVFAAVAFVGYYVITSR
jgi:S-adenosylmethionine synthetase